jgi:glycosyltransferase involved in cell wall biosynthesis
MKVEILGSAASIHTIKWANFLSSEGLMVRIISFDPGDARLNSQIRVMVVPRIKTLFFNPLKFSRFISEHSGYSSDILHIHSFGSYGLLSLFLKHNTRIGTPWGSDVLLLKNNFLKKWIVRRVIASCTKITCDSFEMKSKLIQYGARKDLVHIINFGVDTKTFRRIKTSENQPKRSFTIISTRSFEPIYDIETLIRATHQLIRANFNVKLLLIGSGSTENKLRQLSTELSILGDVQFVGKVNNADLPNYLNLADIYVSTALSDAGIAASTAEAMSCECICVVTDVRENAEWITDGVNGFLFQPTSVESLRDKLISILQSNMDLRQIGIRAREKILLDNDYAKEMDKVVNLYWDVQKNA